jgi:hypothetical protein
LLNRNKFAPFNFNDVLCHGSNNFEISKMLSGSLFGKEQAGMRNQLDLAYGSQSVAIAVV